MKVSSKNSLGRPETPKAEPVEIFADFGGVGVGDRAEVGQKTVEEGSAAVGGLTRRVEVPSLAATTVSIWESPEVHFVVLRNQWSAPNMRDQCEYCCAKSK